MISFLNGKIRSIYPESSVVELDVSGVGYEVVLPVFIKDSLSEKGIASGSEVTFEIYYHSTERSPKPLLVGFLNKLEKKFFEKIIQVEGVGPLKAVSCLIFPVAVISQAIENEDLTVLNQMPGIGARAAQKMIATLKGKLLEIISEVQSSQTELLSDIKVRDQALQILTGLGLKEPDAIIKMNEVFKSNPELSEDVEGIIREVFKENIG